MSLRTNERAMSLIVPWTDDATMIRVLVFRAAAAGRRSIRTCARHGNRTYARADMASSSSRASSSMSEARIAWDQSQQAERHTFIVVPPPLSSSRHRRLEVQSNAPPPCAFSHLAIGPFIRLTKRIYISVCQVQLCVHTYLIGDIMNLIVFPIALVRRKQKSASR